MLNRKIKPIKRLTRIAKRNTIRHTRLKRLNGLSDGIPFIVCPLECSTISSFKGKLGPNEGDYIKGTNKGFNVCFTNGTNVSLTRCDNEKLFNNRIFIKMDVKALIEMDAHTAFYSIHTGEGFSHGDFVLSKSTINTLSTLSRYFHETSFKTTFHENNICVRSTMHGLHGELNRLGTLLNLDFTITGYKMYRNRSFTDPQFFMQSGDLIW